MLFDKNEHKLYYIIMSKRKKKISKNRKKFFIIISCYIIVFMVTAILTASTLSWFSGSTWSTEILYMGGPVYIYFSDDSGVKNTSGANQMVIELPPKWDKLYPGMNIKFEAKAVIQGGKWEKPKYNDETVEIYTTGCILRAKVLLEVTTPKGTKYPSEDATAEDIHIAQSLYNNLWPQLQAKAQKSDDGTGKWVFDLQNTEKIEENYFYYILSNQSTQSDIGKYNLVEVGGVEENVAVGFLNDAVITLSGLGFVNEHADCDIKFTIVFHALQAFLPYEEEDLDQPYQGDTTGRPSTVVWSDIGLAKPLTLGNSRRVFAEAFSVIYDQNPDAGV